MDHPALWGKGTVFFARHCLGQKLVSDVTGSASRRSVTAQGQVTFYVKTGAIYVRINLVTARKSMVCSQRRVPPFCVSVG